MALNTDLMFSSRPCVGGIHDTPDDLITDLKTVFDFDLDVCADRPNVCDFYYNKNENGLDRSWLGTCWMNPPYGRKIYQWVRKASLHYATATVVCLLPARTDTRWWQEHIERAALVTFVKGRFVFGSDDAWVRHRLDRYRKRKITYSNLRKKIGYKQMREYAPDLIGGIEPIKWLGTDFVKKDSAPFPSAFVVFGALNYAQIDKLSSYGWSVSP